jgi:hypothetical protein
VKRILLLVLVVLVACTRDQPAAAPGNERAPCKAGSCDPGLVCLSDRCVRPPGADCQQVAEALTSLELGNYAAAEERRPKVTLYAGKCEAQHLTKDEGACVIAAKSVDQLRLCPKPVMFPPYKPTKEGEVIAGLPRECSEYLATLESYTHCNGLPADARKSIATTVAEMRKSWSIFSEKMPMPPAVSDACKQGNAAIAKAMVTFKCN